jgi:hypothetical protein
MRADEAPPRRPRPPERVPNDMRRVPELFTKLSTSFLRKRYRRFTEAELEVVRREAVEFVGDIPAHAGLEPTHHREEFRIPRTSVEVEDLLYTPEGLGLVDGSISERYSLRQPSMKELLWRPSKASAVVLERATVVQAQYTLTYGDWILEHLLSLARSWPIRPPLLMPNAFMDRSYVRRDLALLGIEVVTVERPVLIRKALVLPQYLPRVHSWSRDDVAALRLVFGIEPITARRGSLIYLSREGENDVANPRGYPSELTARIVTDLGARVVLARRTTYQDYRALANEAETVIADHGSAMCNLLFWNTRTVLELFNDSWWNGYFLCYGKALGVENYALIRTNGVDESQLRHKIESHLEAFRF